MSYQIYGYVQIKKENKWVTAPVYYKRAENNFEPVVLWHGREVGQYLWQKGTYVTEDETKDFIREMGYDEDDAVESVKAISLAYMKYIALTFNPDHNDYDYGGDEDRIKPGIEDIVHKVEAVVEFANFYGNLDEVRFIFHESY
jgi:hypothetical protein